MSHAYVPQVDVGNYQTKNYLTAKRWSTHALVIKEVLLAQPKTVLEIGPGNFLVHDALRTMGFSVKTLDIDKELQPNFHCDIASDDVLKIRERFDLVIASEVLEHVRYNDALSALSNLHQLTSRVILTLPHTNARSIFGGFRGKIPGLKFFGIFTKIFLFRKVHEFNGQHYWEIGKKNYALASVHKAIESVGWRIDSSYINPDNTYHHVLVLSDSSL